MRSIKDKVVIITGASRGIGEGIAEKFAKAVLFPAKQNNSAWTSMADIRPLIIKRT